MKLKGSCLFCGSCNIKVSSTYPSDYYCTDCTSGGLLSSLNKTTNSVWDKINNYFVHPDENKIFTYLKPSTTKLAKCFKITQVHSHRDLSLCFALTRPVILDTFTDYPQPSTACPTRFMKHVKETHGWLLWRNDLEAILNFHFGISNSALIIKKLLKRQTVDLTSKLSTDEIEWLKTYAPSTIAKSIAQAYAKITVREFEKSS